MIDCTHTPQQQQQQQQFDRSLGGGGGSEDDDSDDTGNEGAAAATSAEFACAVLSVNGSGGEAYCDDTAPSVAIACTLQQQPQPQQQQPPQSHSRLLQLPIDILRYCTPTYLTDADAVMFGRTCTTALTLMYTYPMKSELPLSIAIRSIATSTAVITTTTTADTADTPTDNAAAPSSPSSASSSPSSPSSSPSSPIRLIGTPIHVKFSLSNQSNIHTRTSTTADSVIGRHSMFTVLYTAVTASHHLSHLPSLRTLTVYLENELCESELAHLHMSDSITALHMNWSRYSGSLRLLRLPAHLHIFTGIKQSVDQLPQWSHCQELHTIEFDSFDYPVDTLQLPATLTSLNLSYAFNQPVDALRLPPTLTSLTFGDYFDQPIDRLQLPAGLKELRFTPDEDLWCAFNQDIQQVHWPSSLTVLQLSQAFDKPVDALQLPDSLTDLEMGRKFDQSISSLRLPSQLRILSFGRDATEEGVSSYFNQSLDGVVFPPSLTALELSTNFRQPLVNWTPPQSVVSFTLPSEWNLPFNQLRLPPHIETLVLPDEIDTHLSQLNMPQTLTSIALNPECIRAGEPIEWPVNIKEVTLTERSGSHPLIHMRDLQLPQSLLRLIARDGWNRFEGYAIEDCSLPPQLQFLNVRLSVKADLRQWSLPNTISTLVLHDVRPTYSLAGCRLSASLHTLLLPSCDITHLTGIDWSHTPSLTALHLGSGGVALPPHACAACGDAAVASTVSLRAVLTSRSLYTAPTETVFWSPTTAVTDASAVCRLAHLLPRTLLHLRFSEILPAAKSCADDNSNVSECVHVPVLLPPTLLLPPALQELAIYAFPDGDSEWDKRYSSILTDTHTRIPFLLQSLPFTLHTLFLRSIDLSLRAMPSLPPHLHSLYLPLTSNDTYDEAREAAIEWMKTAAQSGALPAQCVASNAQREGLRSWC